MRAMNTPEPDLDTVLEPAALAEVRSLLQRIEPADVPAEVRRAEISGALDHLPDLDGDPVALADLDDADPGTADAGTADAGTAAPAGPIHLDAGTEGPPGLDDLDDLEGLDGPDSQGSAPAGAQPGGPAPGWFPARETAGEDWPGSPPEGPEGAGPSLARDAAGWGTTDADGAGYDPDPDPEPDPGPGPDHSA